MFKFAPRLIAPPTSTPVSLAEAKSHVGAEYFDDDDAILTAFIAAATDHLDGWRGYLRRPIVAQSWALDLTSSDVQELVALPFGPVLGIDDVTIGGSLIIPADYEIFEASIGSYIRFKTVPQVTGDTPEKIGTIEFTAGYLPADVPPGLKAAILLHVGDLYEHREINVPGVSVTNTRAYETLIKRFRNFT